MHELGDAPGKVGSYWGERVTHQVILGRVGDAPGKVGSYWGEWESGEVTMEVHVTTSYGMQ